MNPIKTCLIGGSGFIGTTLSQLLIDQGREVTILNLGDSPPSDPAIRYIAGDYGDRAFLEKALVGIDEVILLAYASVPKTSFEDPLADLTSNLPPALTLLR